MEDQEKKPGDDIFGEAMGLLLAKTFKPVIFVTNGDLREFRAIHGKLIKYDVKVRDDLKAYTASKTGELKKSIEETLAESVALRAKHSALVTPAKLEAANVTKHVHNWERFNIEFYHIYHILHKRVHTAAEHLKEEFKNVEKMEDIPDL